MRALTLWQPWANVIVFGPKRIENRPWACPQVVIGKRIAIHAGKVWDPEGYEFCRKLGFDIPRTKCLAGWVIGTALVSKVLDFAKEEDHEGLPDEQYPWFFGPYGWVLDDVKPCSPFEIRGAQGLWEIPPSFDDYLEATSQLRTPK